MGEKIFNKIHSCAFKRSGVVIVGIYGHYINVYKYKPLKGGLILNYQMILKIVVKD